MLFLVLKKIQEFAFIPYWIFSFIWHICLRGDYAFTSMLFLVLKKIQEFAFIPYWIFSFIWHICLRGEWGKTGRGAKRHIAIISCINTLALPNEYIW